MKRAVLLSVAMLVVVWLNGCAHAPTKGLERPRLAPVAVSAYDNFRLLRLAEHNPKLIVGATVVDITPKRSKDVWIAGYMPNKHATGTDTPITARIIYIDDGDEALAIVALDFIGFMNPDIQIIRSLVSKDFQDEIVVLSTHNHAGPDVMGMWGRALFYMIPVENGRDEGYIERIRIDIAKGILRAQRNAVPARLFVAQTKGPEGYCDNWRIPGFWDDTITALMAVDESGTPIATLSNWTCHAEFLGEKNTHISADFPYYFNRRMQMRGAGVSIYTNGALGGIVVPIIGFANKALPVSLRARVAMNAGFDLADTILSALESDAEEIVEPRIVHKMVRFDLPVDNWRFLRLMSVGILDRALYRYAGFRQNPDRIYLRTEAHAIAIGPLAIATVPGEIFPSIGFGIKQHILEGYKYKMLFGLSGDELGYIMLPDEFKLSLYDYEKSVSLGPDTGRILWESLLWLWTNGKNIPLPDAPTPPSD